MPDMPESISKGPILRAFDRLTTPQMQQLLSALQVNGENSDIPAVLDSLNMLTTEQKDHLRHDWFGSWWPNSQPVQPIIARGMMTALEKAISIDKPLDCYWVCSTGHHEMGHQETKVGMDGAIEMAVMWTDCHVTVLIHTPGGGMNSIQDQPLTQAEPIFVIARGDNNVIGVFQPMSRPDQP